MPWRAEKNAYSIWYRIGVFLAWLRRIPRARQASMYEVTMQLNGVQWVLDNTGLGFVPGLFV